MRILFCAVVSIFLYFFYHHLSHSRIYTIAPQSETILTIGFSILCFSMLCSDVYLLINPPTPYPHTFSHHPPIQIVISFRSIQIVVNSYHFACVHVMACCSCWMRQEWCLVYDELVKDGELYGAPRILPICWCWCCCCWCVCMLALTLVLIICRILVWCRARVSLSATTMMNGTDRNAYNTRCVCVCECDLQCTLSFVLSHTLQTIQSNVHVYEWYKL